MTVQFIVVYVNIKFQCSMVGDQKEKKVDVLRKSSKFGKRIIVQVNIIHSSKNMIRLGGYT